MKRHLGISEAAKLQLMAMSAEEKKAALKAIEGLTEDPEGGIPLEDYLATLPPEQADEIREHLAAALRLIEEEMR
jgi:hypothetical protein